MKFVDRIINDIPKVGIESEDSEYKDELKYLADSRVILDELKDYEVEIPKEYFDKYENEFGNGVLQYMEKLTDTKMEDFNGGNTYNWNGRIMHDFDYRYCQTNKDEFYVAIQVHRFGDVRGNYTEFALFKFEYFEEFIETIDTICSEKMGGCFEYKGKHYYYDFSIFSEWLRVWCEETQEDFDIYAYNDESFKEEIDKLEKESE